MAKGFFSRFTRSVAVDAPDPRPALPAIRSESTTSDVAEVVRHIARQGLPAAPRKEAISLRLDAEVLDWFRAQGPGYQTRINAVLRAYKDAAG
jgi:uncharacterized protein (DUF4415 family)